MGGGDYYNHRAYSCLGITFIIVAVPLFIFLITACWDNSASAISIITCLLKFESEYRMGYMPKTLCYNARDLGGWICGYRIGERNPNALVQFVDEKWWIVMFPAIGLVAVVVSFVHWAYSRGIMSSATWKRTTHGGNMAQAPVVLVVQGFCVAAQLVSFIVPLVLVKNYADDTGVQVGFGVYLGAIASGSSIIASIVFVLEIKAMDKYLDKEFDKYYVTPAPA